MDSKNIAKLFKIHINYCFCCYELDAQYLNKILSNFVFLIIIVRLQVLRGLNLIIIIFFLLPINIMILFRLLIILNFSYPFFIIINKNYIYILITSLDF